MATQHVDLNHSVQRHIAVPSTTSIRYCGDGLVWSRLWEYWRAQSLIAGADLGFQEAAV